MSVLTTQRLVLREVTHQDACNLSLVLSNPEVMKHSVRGVHSPAQIQEYIDNTKLTYERYGFGQWIITTKADEFIGICGLNKHQVDGEALTHIMYRLAPNQQGQGYALEAVKGVLNYAQTRLIGKAIYALIEPTNEASIKVALKAGLTLNKQVEFAGALVNLYRINN